MGTVKVDSFLRLCSRFFGWIRENKAEAVSLFVILVVGSFLRLYRISEYMTFLGDEGRDAVLVRRLLVNFDPILIGPGTSIGNMYLGPLYYYMMAPALFLANFSPVGPAIQIAILGIVTIIFVWLVAKEWFPFPRDARSGQVNWGAIIAAGFYAISPTVITYSRSSWNPNIMPFFSLLTIYAIWKVWKYGEGNWLVVAGVAYAFVLQSHYLGLLLLPTIGIFWFLAIRKIRDSKRVTDSVVEIQKFLQKSLIGFLIFTGLMSPLAIFDARHGWRNFGAMKKFFTERQTTVSARPWNAIPKIYPIFEKTNTRLLAGRNEIAGKFTSVAIVLLSGSLILSKKKKPKSHATSYLLLSTWLGFAVAGLSLYKQEIYDHYYGLFFPAPFLLLGAIGQRLAVTNKRLIKAVLLVVCLLLVVVNLHNSPLRYPPTRQLQRSISVAQKIKNEAGGERFNLAVIAERNYEDGYQYFLELWRQPVVDIDAQLPQTVTNQLFAVCEMEESKCDPTHSPKAEIANFGWSVIDADWEVSGVKIYRLAHTK